MKLSSISFMATPAGWPGKQHHSLCLEEEPLQRRPRLKKCTTGTKIAIVPDGGRSETPDFMVQVRGEITPGAVTDYGGAANAASAGPCLVLSQERGLRA